ncbi:hypothetical protein GCM10010324_07020 [Streptomyces hiroshimensis]|uniref:Uncharacterized protein n=1 Tax=Streptomyces hiroshimensis TaxID=66424 RepID=A0ABQ2Y4L7_9ACTN|nr:hypothetical protein GCM10010324_07020 [Streptomyces hiroshimensis]
MLSPEKPCTEGRQDCCTGKFTCICARDPAQWIPGTAPAVRPGSYHGGEPGRRQPEVHRRATPPSGRGRREPAGQGQIAEADNGMTWPHSPLEVP